MFAEVMVINGGLIPSQPTINNKGETMEINGITITAPVFYKVDKRGDMYTSKLVGRYTFTQVRASLIGQPYKDGTIQGVEMFAIEPQTDTPIGLLIN